jgi:hypothetical protein
LLHGKSRILITALLAVFVKGINVSALIVKYEGFAATVNSCGFADVASCLDVMAKADSFMWRQIKQMGWIAALKFCHNLGIAFEDCYFMCFGRLPVSSVVFLQQNDDAHVELIHQFNIFMESEY